MEKDNTKPTDEDKSAKFAEHLDIFLQLKQIYETKNRQNARKDKKSQPQCIECKKPGGTLFSMKNNRYTAVCNAKINCGLHLEIFRGGFIDSSAALTQYRQVLEDSKDAIIKLKNNGLYNYIQDVDAKKTYEKENAHYVTVNTLFTELHRCMNDNPEVAKRIEEKIEAIGEVTQIIHDLIADYQKSGQQQRDFLEQAVTIERTQLLPLMDDLRNLKYGIVEMSVIPKFPNSIMKKDIYISRLIERRLKLTEEEINLKEAPEVKKWNLTVEV
jgi:hypothetical protein